MSTKNLSRTVIEGGRTGTYKASVGLHAASERVETRLFLRSATVDPESVDDQPSPLRKVVYREFADKTHPLLRFLHSRVGKLWNETYTLIRQRFDVRTTPGRHVIFDHLLNDINLSGTDYDRYPSRFYVDEEGVLQRRTSNQERWGRKTRWETFHATALLQWLDHRWVGMSGARLLWMNPQETRRVTSVLSVKDGYQIVRADAKGQPIVLTRWLSTTGQLMAVTRSLSPYERAKNRIEEVRDTVKHFQNGKLLRSSEESYFRSLPEAVQTLILSSAPRNYDARGPVHINRPLWLPLKLVA